METTQQAKQIRTAMDQLRRKQITPDAFRSTMAQIRQQMGEQDFNAAKFLAAANDR